MVSPREINPFTAKAGKKESIAATNKAASNVIERELAKQAKQQALQEGKQHGR